MFLGYRSNDPVITICQDNAARSIEIREVNAPTEDLLGYPAAAMNGHALAEFVPARIAELLNEYVEFEDDGNDVGSVLSKVQSFCLTDHKGREIAFRLKVLRAESSSKNAFFKLILQSGQGNRRTEAFRAILRENFKGHEVIDPATGLPDRASIIKDVEFVLAYVHKGELAASFAIFELDDAKAIIRRHGEAMPAQLLKHIAALARQNLRGDDMIGCLSPDRLGFILLDTNPESARMVLNRLRWLIAANPLQLPGQQSASATVSIGFAAIGGRVDDKAVVADCEAFMERLPDKARNSLQEVPELTAREQPPAERRRENVPVVFDRRKGNRRKDE